MIFKNLLVDYMGFANIFIADSKLISITLKLGRTKMEIDHLSNQFVNYHINQIVRIIKPHPAH
jgi:hypothetical protein